MESIVARAFKSSSFFSEVAMKPVNSQPLGVGDDYLFVSPTGPAAGDDFSVDEFFDLQGLSEEEEEEDKSSSSSSSSLSSQDQIDEGSSFSGGFSATGVSGFLSGADGLALPGEDMKELELWSHLMDETLSDDVFACPARNAYVKPGPDVEKRARFEPETKPVILQATRFPPPIPAKMRSKRLRTASGAWSACSLLKPDYSLSNSLTALLEPGFAFEKAVQENVVGTGSGKSKKSGVKKPKRKPATLEDGDSPAGSVQQRKCTHCQVQKTPQWRTGPLGPKTLCNACGVRFKSGRLFPEYRPACSPTFSSEVHSNSHRKVLEMRKNVSEPTGPVLLKQF